MNKRKLITLDTTVLEEIRVLAFYKNISQSALIRDYILTGISNEGKKYVSKR